MSWKAIPDFPEYSVSNMGQIRNDDTGRILALSRNAQGVVQVGLSRDGRQHKRGVALLVAQAFLGPSALEPFDTPIHLDGDQTNNAVNNLMWRPRWFAIKYQRQFRTQSTAMIRQPLIDKKTSVHYHNSWDAATKCGLLDREVFLAIQNRTYVWPTYQEFRVVEED